MKLKGHWSSIVQVVFYTAITGKNKDGAGRISFAFLPAQWGKNCGNMGSS